MKGGNLIRGWTAFSIIALVTWTSHSFAQVTPKRLSDWLLEQPSQDSESAYALGLSWRVPEETVSQTAARVNLLAALSSSNP